MLFRVIIDDLRNNVTESGAGWRNPSNQGITSEQLNELYKLGIIERNLLGEIRLSFRDRNIRSKLTSFKMQFDQIDYFIKYRDIIRKDEKKLQKAQEIFMNVKYIINDNPDILPSIVAVGLWKMLNTSDMAVTIDEVLKEGFSPRNWAFASIHAIPTLSLNLAKKVGKIEKLTDAFEYIKKVGLIRDYPSFSALNNDDVQKVIRVLKWDKIEKNLTEENIKFLGQSWFMVFVLKMNDALPLYADFSVKIMDLIKDSFEEIFNTNWFDSINNLKNSVASLEEQRVTWVSNIIFLPEVV